jgi:hypothetical protein
MTSKYVQTLLTTLLEEGAYRKYCGNSAGNSLHTPCDNIQCKHCPFDRNSNLNKAVDVLKETSNEQIRRNS